jgi:hypothetical protein
VLIVWRNNFSYVTFLVNGSPLLIRNRTERKIYWLTTDVAEDWLLVHGARLHLRRENGFERRAQRFVCAHDQSEPEPSVA